MLSEIALDTSIVIPIFDNDPVLRRRFADIETAWIPVPVIAEIAVGFSDASPHPSQQSEFELFLSSLKVLECTSNVAMRYGTIHRLLRGKGSMIPINDIWIAACCLEAGLPLATRDNHFLRIPDLKIEMW